MAGTIPLEQVQAWMQSAIVHPDGVVEGMRDSTATRRLPLTVASIGTLIAPSQALSSIQRLEIYARAYSARLLECLRAEFPILAKAMGDGLFDQFAVDYLRRYPSTSYTLGDLGRRFPDFLAETRPPPKHPGQPDWCDLFIDLARLEWTFSEVFDGPGIENQPPLDARQFQAIPPTRWHDIRLVPAPCLRLAQFQFPVGRYYRALREGAEASLPDAAPTFLAVTRRDYVCRHYELSPDEFDLLTALIRGQTLGQAIASHAIDQSPGDIDRLASRIRAWFERWSSEAFFIKAVCHDPPPTSGS